MSTIDPLILARLLEIPQIEIAARLDVTPVWARTLAKDKRHARRVRIAVLKAALERESLEEAIAGLPR